MSTAVVMTEGEEGSMDKKLVAYIVPDSWQKVRDGQGGFRRPPVSRIVVAVVGVGVGAGGLVVRSCLIRLHASCALSPIMCCCFWFSRPCVCWCVCVYLFLFELVTVAMQ